MGSSRMRILKSWIALSLITFIPHLFWESFHISLYGGYDNLSPYLPISIWATIGDVFYTLAIVGLISVFKNNLHWIENRMSKKDIISLAVAGFLVALSVEYKAIALDRWFYLPNMPVIPILEVGLSPILQMTLLLPLSVYVTGKVIALVRSQ